LYCATSSTCCAASSTCCAARFHDLRRRFAPFEGCRTVGAEKPYHGGTERPVRGWGGRTGLKARADGGISEVWLSGGAVDVQGLLAALR
jgi:hypothetical protein